MKYADQASIVKEKQREQWFRDEGFGVVRWLGNEIFVRVDGGHHSPDNPDFDTSGRESGAL